MVQETNMETLILSIIEREETNAQTETDYRKPLVGFAELRYDGFRHLRETVGPHHLMPDDVLKGAQSMVAFFLPFSGRVVDANFRSDYVAREWAMAYVETNRLINHICETLVCALDEAGIEAAFEPPTYSFDKRKLVACWSHKSIAALAGLGSFGLNRLLITDAGCAGRFGSLLVRAKLTPTTAEPKERCLRFHDGSCKLCIERCPVNAIKENGQFDREACYRYLMKTDAFFSDLPLTDVCGKCSVGLPCSLRSAVRNSKSKSR